MSNAQSTSPYTVRSGYVTQDREDVLAIWRGTLGEESRMQAKYDWFYTACPLGEPALCLLQHASDETLIGVAAAGSRRMQFADKTFNAGVLVDLAVSAEHRSLGPALMLQTALREAGSTRFELLYGFPNPKAAPVFKRVGYSLLTQITREARVLRHASYLARRMPRALAGLAGLLLDCATHLRDRWRSRADKNLLSEWKNEVDDRFDTLWSKSAKLNTTLTIRDSQFLQWRFDSAPFVRTRYLLLIDPEQSNLRAWFACQIEDKVLHVRDFWSEDAATGIGRHFIDALLSAARRDGNIAVSYEFAGPSSARAGWHAAGFIERSRRPVYGKWIHARESSAVDWHLTSADEDE